jgi:hypothetical protein
MLSHTLVDARGTNGELPLHHVERVKVYALVTTFRLLWSNPPVCRDLDRDLGPERD